MVAHSHHLGGIERHVLTLALALREAGHAVAYAGPYNGWLGEQMRDAAVEGIDLPMHGMYDPLSAWRLAGFARRWKAGVLHGHALRGGRYADWASRRSGVPAVVTAHSTNAFKWFHPGMRLMAVSGAVRRALIDAGLPGERVAVVYNGMPDPGEPPPRAVPAFSNHRPMRLALVGRLEPVKGLDIALDALGLLRRDRGGDLPLQLTVVGPHETDWAGQMRQKVQSLGLGSVVTFLGHRQDVLALLAQTDLALAPSRREALSLALVEAAAVGCPALASRVGGIPEVVADGEGGRLLPGEDAPALAEALQQVLADPACLPRWSAAARQRYRERFTVEAMCNGVLAQYRAAQVEKGVR